MPRLDREKGCYKPIGEEETRLAEEFGNLLNTHIVFFTLELTFVMKIAVLP